MSNTINNPNFLTFPIVFDPFRGYENHNQLIESAPDSKTEKTSARKISNGDIQQDPLFISMVCHQIQNTNESKEIDLNEDCNETINGGVLNDKTTHPLG